MTADRIPPELEDRRRETLRRLRWRGRRGLLENDLLIQRFLDREGDALNAADVQALGRLLELPDPVLFELLLGRQPPAGELDAPAIRNMLGRLGSNAMKAAVTASKPL
jgi:antitoxin CptB